MPSVLDQLKGPKRDAAAALIALFRSYGLGSLAPKIVEFAKQGYGGDAMITLLQETKEYQKRFAANDARRAAGLPVLPPADYLATERAYAQALQAAGMPRGFYDQPERDFKTFLERDVAPTEIAERAGRARELVNTIDPTQRNALARRLGLSANDLAAYFLDPKRALPILQKEIDTTLLGAERERAGYGYNAARAEMLYSAGVDVQAAREGYGTIAEMEPTLSKLGEISDVDYGVEELEAEVFGSSGEAAGKRKKLASQERARFSGSAGTATRTLERTDEFNR